MSPYFAFLIGLMLCMLVMTLVWWWQLHTQNAGIVDGWWAFNFGILVILYGTLSEINLYRLLVAGVVTIWSVRLGSHLLFRNTQHTDEDIRYKELRISYGNKATFYMWRFFMYQAVSNALLSYPFLILLFSPIQTVGWIWAGLVIWLIGFLGEMMADLQLQEFKKDSGNKGLVCNRGLWKYSRHPNYFFEWVIWLSYGLMALGVDWGWTALWCPLLMYWLLTHVTGIPMLEDLAVKSKGLAYIHYQQTTNAFFPWFKKQSNSGLAS